MTPTWDEEKRFLTEIENKLVELQVAMRGLARDATMSARAHVRLGAQLLEVQKLLSARLTQIEFTPTEAQP